MSKLEITAVLQPDIRNPHDKIIFNPMFLPTNTLVRVTFGVQSASEGNIKSLFSSLAIGGLVAIHIGADETETVHRLFQLLRGRQGLARVDLLAKKKAYMAFEENNSTFVRTAVYHPATMIASIGMEDVKMVDIVPNSNNVYTIYFNAN